MSDMPDDREPFRAKTTLRGSAPSNSYTKHTYTNNNSRNRAPDPIHNNHKIHLQKFLLEVYAEDKMAPYLKVQQYDKDDSYAQCIK